MKKTQEIQTKDGTSLGLTVYHPEHANGKLIIVAPTGGVTQQFYKTFALHFSGMGYRVITFDYRGMGRSAPEKLKGFRASLHQWAVQDIDAVILFSRNQFPMQEIIFVGHCVGGEIVGLARASEYLHKLILVNSALSCRKLWPLKYRVKKAALKQWVQFWNRWFGYFPGNKGGYAENMPGHVMAEWAGWCGNSNGLFDQFPDNNYRKMQIPLLAYTFSDNWNTPKKAVRELLNRFSSAFITWHHLSPAMLGVKNMGHHGFFYPEGGERLWLQVHEWVLESDRLRAPA